MEAEAEAESVPLKIEKKAQNSRENIKIGSERSRKSGK